MAGAQDGDKGQDQGQGQRQDGTARHVYGPRALGALLPPITRPAFRRRAPAAAQLMADWPAIVGPALAAVAHPRRLSGGTLTLGCTGPQALELQHLAAALIDRINAQLGRVTVERLRFVQEAPAAAPAGPPARVRREAAAVPQVAGLPPGDLRAALERLGQAVLTAAPRE